MAAATTTGRTELDTQRSPVFSTTCSLFRLLRVVSRRHRMAIRAIAPNYLNQCCITKTEVCRKTWTLLWKLNDED